MAPGKMKKLVRRDAVRKRLFGSPDTGVVQDLRRELRQFILEATERWNFVFLTETPLPGKLQWEKYPMERTATFYHESSVRNIHLTSEGCNAIQLSNEETAEVQLDMWSVEGTPNSKLRTLPKPTIKTAHDVMATKKHVPGTVDGPYKSLRF